MVLRPGLHAVTLALVLTCVGAQSSTYSLSCLPDSGVSALTACNSLYNQIVYCAGPSVAPGAPYIQCYCNQQVYNGFYNCESEQRVCKGNDNYDYIMQRQIDVWNSVCSQSISFTPTTPTVTSLTSTVNRQYCVTAASACARATNILLQCSASSTGDRSQFSSCTCQPSLISAEYSCLFLGNASCFATPAVLTNLPVYTECVNERPVLASIASMNNSTSSIPPSNSATTTKVSTMSASISTLSATRPALPSAISSSTTQSVSSSVAISLLYDYTQLYYVLAFWFALGSGVSSF